MLILVFDQSISRPLKKSKKNTSLKVFKFSVESELEIEGKVLERDLILNPTLIEEYQLSQFKLLSSYDEC